MPSANSRALRSASLRPKRSPIVFRSSRSTWSCTNGGARHRNYLGHDSPEGQDFIYRHKRDRCRCEVRVGQNIYTGAQNVADGTEARAARRGNRACGFALGRLYNSVTKKNGVAYYDWNSPEAIARQTVEGWMQSTGHRENILAPHWKRQGIGVEIGSDNRVLITQNLC